jgi:hypothetical protein
VIWTRVLAMTLGPTTYAFSAMHIDNVLSRYASVEASRAVPLALWDTASLCPVPCADSGVPSAQHRGRAGRPRSRRHRGRSRPMHNVLAGSARTCRGTRCRSAIGARSTGPAYESAAEPAIKPTALCPHSAVCPWRFRVDARAAREPGTIARPCLVEFCAPRARVGAPSDAPSCTTRMPESAPPDAPIIGSPTVMRPASRYADNCRDTRRRGLEARGIRERLSVPNPAPRPTEAVCRAAALPGQLGAGQRVNMPWRVPRSRCRS